MTTVLLTGFEPFEGESINPSLEAVKALDDVVVEDYNIIAKPLPTVFGESIAKLHTYIEEVSPSIVICVGQAGGREEITVERIAINVDDARIPDNIGQQPIDRSIIENGPAAYFSTLPIKAAVENLRQAGIPSSVSQTAGTFVCNHVFYGLMNMIQNCSIKGGFVHIPYLPEQAVNHPGKASMSLDLIVQGLLSVVKTTILVEEDILVSGGATH
ncbi:pyroglutamyl-peptidase I [Priestia megaterium]|uniref:pyroglutamyl-peptidase I n=1 Tax=Priestia megaterium TaxID=1404 RepID=UPI002282C1F9|nr:pyroglutamyl-peptidase I [Priestia megaterium]MCY9023203.1 pyroglutamyl-peptidase I [Priestia megaterium]